MTLESALAELARAIQNRKDGCPVTLSVAAAETLLNPPLENTNDGGSDAGNIENQ